MKFKYYLIVFLSVFLLSCATVPKPKEATTIETNKIIKEIIKDTVFITKKDSSFYKAYIKCINNEPVIVGQQKTRQSGHKKVFPKAVSGKFLEPPNVHLKNNVLSVSCKAEAQRLFVKWKEQHIQEQSNKTKTIVLPPKLIEKELSWWQQLWIVLGKIFQGIITFWVLSKIPWRNFLKLLP